MTEKNLSSATQAHDPPWRFLTARQICRLLPPLLAPRVSGILYPFDSAEKSAPWVYSITGARARWPLADIHGHHLAVNGYHDWRLLAAAHAIARPGDTVIEVGANIGTETIGLSAIVGSSGKVFALEPLPANAAVLRQVLADAVITNVILLEAAACETPGTRSFVLPSRHMSGTGYLGSLPEAAGEAITVEATTLDLIRAQHAMFPSLLVMDVEGAELSVLQGASEIILNDRPSIILEACERHAARAGSNLNQLHEALSDWGYSIRSIGRYRLGAASTKTVAQPCNWIAVPKERQELLDAVTRSLLHSGFMPPLKHLNPLATRH